MRELEDNYSLIDENSSFEMAIASNIGDRDEQQDSAGYSLKDNEGIIIVCDGMGGLNGGRLASNVAVDGLLNIYDNCFDKRTSYDILSNSAVLLDEKVFNLEDENGNKISAGTTIVSVIINDNDMTWLSVGDSRIYVKRESKLLCVTKDQNYQMVLDQRKLNNNISNEEYFEEMNNGDNLISFLGINGLPLYDCNSIPLQLEKGDEVLLASDGLYKLLDDTEILDILANFTNVKDAVNALEFQTQRASRKKYKKRDNITLALIKIK